jgi:hypothetical protein
VSKRTVPGIALAVAALVVAVLVVVWRSESASSDPSRAAAAAAERAALAARSTPPRLLPVPAPAPPAAPPIPPPPSPLAAVDASAPAPPVALTEGKLMEKLRKARAAGQHALAIELAREGNRRFANSAMEPERESILIHSLADGEQRSEARGEAERMVNHYPDSDWVREIERFTGAHRHRNVRLNDAGEIEYY